MSNRTKATSIPKKVREEVYKRDKGCIICGSIHNLTIAHFISRAKSGMGVKENLVTLCIFCHHEMDNGKNSLEIKARVKKYLDNLYPDFTDEMRIYDKWRKE
jgi:5-methylcytosine-specific restriction endonuclease McrA